MKIPVFILILFFTVIPNDLNRIAEINKYKREAKEAYEAGNYRKAAEAYQYLVDSLEVADENVLLNLSNAYFNLNDTTNARKYYSLLTSSQEDEIRSRSFQQLGIMDFKSKNHKQALQNFKQSLKALPNNEEARYNYELLKKILKEQEQQQKEQNQDQKKQDQQQNQDEDQQDQQQDQDDEQEGDQEKQEDQQKSDEQKEGEEQNPEQRNESEREEEKDQNKENPISNAENLEELNISEEKARMILEAMKNNEIQYIQQNRRKAKSRNKSGKPDW